jgi:drug/metabolite transporter (DMT)-like permease
MLGAFLALLSAALFGLNNAATRRGVLGGTVMQGMALTVPIGMVLFFIAALLTGTLGAVTSFSPWALMCFALAGVAHFVLGRYCNYRAIAAIGTNLASPIQQWEILVTLVLALSFLGERLTPISVIAIWLLLAGPAIASRIEKRRAAAKAAGGEQAEEASAHKFQPRYKEGYTWAFLSIFGYGVSPILVRSGFESVELSSMFAAGFVSYAAASAVVAIWVVGSGKLGHALSLKGESRRWFVFAGVLVCVSQMLRYPALALVPVVVFAPIIRLQTLFRIYFSWILTRDHEVFDRHVIVGTLVSLAGAILIALPADLVAASLPLPEWLRGALAWRWP